MVFYEWITRARNISLIALNMMCAIWVIVLTIRYNIDNFSEPEKYSDILLLNAKVSVSGITLCVIYLILDFTVKGIDKIKRS